MKQRVLVTGGNGFTGSHIVRELLDHGHEVTCLVRPGSNRRNLDGLTVTLVEGDITDGEQLPPLFHGYDAVIHNAALVNDWSVFPEMYTVNVSGTRHVLEACRVNEISHTILTGTISSYGETHSMRQRDESWPDDSHYPYLFDRFFPCRMNHYRDTKATATRKAVDFAREHHLDLTVLEPAFVYGEREFNTGFYEYVKAAQAGIPVAPGNRTCRFPVIYAGDLAKGYRAALQKRLPGIHRIILSNPVNERMDRVLELFCRFSGVRKPLPLPKWLLYGPAAILELWQTVTKNPHPPVLTRGRVNMFTDNLEFSSEKARQVLNFIASTPLEEGIRKTVDWYKANGYL